MLVEAIQNCWADIEPYLDLVSLISVSKSCHTLRDLVVHNETGKIMKSNLIVPSSVELGHPYRARIREYGPLLLNTIHFPSLIKLDINFPSQRLEEVLFGDDSLPPVVHIFASLSADLYNVEELKIDMGSLTDYEEEPVSTYEIIANNLVRSTKKLKKLHINYGGVARKYSNDFLDIMLPVIEECQSLEEVTMWGGGNPSSPGIYPNAEHVFFEAILSLPNLKRLDIGAWHLGELNQPFSSLLDASRSIDNTWGRFPTTSLESIRLILIPFNIDQSPVALLSLDPLLSLISKSNVYIKKLLLCFPRKLWDETRFINSLSRYILERSSSFESIGIPLDRYEDKSGELMKFMQRFVKERPSSKVHFSDMKYIDEQADSIEALQGFSRVREFSDKETTWDFKSPDYYVK